MAETTGGMDLFLADRAHRIAFSWVGSSALRRSLDSTGIMLGTSVDEDSLGNHGLGTPLETGRSVWISGDEHYLQWMKALSSYGHPVRYPLTRRVEGSLDITVVDTRCNPLFGPLLARAAQDIEARLPDGARESERRLFLAFQQATRQRSVPVAVLGGDVVLANRACLDLLGTADATMLRILVPEVSTYGIAARELDLGPMGRVQVTAERIDGTPDGVMFHLGERLAPGLGSATSVPTGRCVLVAGEAGSGRTRAAQELVGGGPVVTLDAAAAVASSERAWANQLIGLAARRGGAVVIDDVHVLPESLCTVLRRVMASARARIVLTSGPIDELPGHVAQVVARCMRRIELPPLRERLHELPALLVMLGTAVRPEREWIFTPRALEALAAQPWTGNFAELAGLVDDLAARLCTGRIDVADLPERYRASARASGLGGRERAERIAIIRALTSAGWQRAAGRRATRHQPHHPVPPYAGPRRVTGHLSSSETIPTHVGRHRVATGSCDRHRSSVVDRPVPVTPSCPTTHELSS